MSNALQIIKRFRLHELNGLRSHIQRFGPLSSSPKLGTSQQSSHSDGQRPTLPNPFLPRLNPKTGRWAPPKYSLRRQAELIKAAKACGVVHLLPPGSKLLHPEHSPTTSSNSQNLSLDGDKTTDVSWAMPVYWDGEIKTKVGAQDEHGTSSQLYSSRKRMFKGHKWERVMEKRTETRNVLMRNMTKRIMRFKQYYRRRRPNPLKPARSAKSSKLPF